MIVAIHQPNYLPYYGYFHKIKYSDVFVFLDNVLYSKNSYINRNKIKGPHGSFWLTVPIVRKNVFNMKILDVKIADNINWRNIHLKSIYYHYKKSNFLNNHFKFFEDIYEREWLFLSEVNKRIITYIAEVLNLKTKFMNASDLEVQGKNTELLIDICTKIGADTYLSGQGGKIYQDEKKFKANNIEVIYQNFSHPKYKQLFGEFIPNLSIVDMLFNENKFIEANEHDTVMRVRKLNI